MGLEDHIEMMEANGVNIMNFFTHLPDHMKIINKDAFTGQADQITHSGMEMQRTAETGGWRRGNNNQPIEA